MAYFNDNTVGGGVIYGSSAIRTQDQQVKSLLLYRLS